MIGQKARTLKCPDAPRLDGQRVLVTGGRAGVGEFVTRGLISRGAVVSTLARGNSKSSNAPLDADAYQADLSDLASIRASVDRMHGKVFDVLVCNAGVNSHRYEKTISGVEKTFAINVLGHHLLYRLMIERKLLAHQARIVITTGDIYVLANDCTPDFKYWAGPVAYARTKLGNLWQVAELSSRFPGIRAIAVHPGVVASGFAGSKEGLVGMVKRSLMISENEGAQAALIGATQAIPRGGYWHNVFGLVDLSPNDPARDQKASAELWSKLEEQAEPYLD